MRPLGVLTKYIDLAFNLASILGAILSTIWVVIFLLTPSHITVSASDIRIQGVPFSWVVYSLFSASLGSVYRSVLDVVNRRKKEDKDEKRKW